MSAPKIDAPLKDPEIGGPNVFIPGRSSPPQTAVSVGVPERNPKDSLFKISDFAFPTGRSRSKRKRKGASRKKTKKAGRRKTRR